MTRKDYQVIAQGFASALQFCKSEAERDGWLLAVADVSRKLQADNPRFDRDKFMVACGCVIG